MGHWLILAALFLYVLRPCQRPQWAWPVLILLAALVHAYLMAMVLGLWLADLAKRGWIEKSMNIKTLSMEGAVTCMALSFILWQAGYFSIPFEGLTAKSGFGVRSMNLLSPINPLDSSLFLPPLPLAAPQQGYNYVGAGVILLLALAGYKGVRDHPSWPAVRPYLPLFAVCVLFFLFALSNVVTLGKHTLFTVPLPEAMQKVGAMFRVSRRMF